MSEDSPRKSSGNWPFAATVAILAFVIAAFTGLAGGFIGAQMVLDDVARPSDVAPRPDSLRPNTGEPVISAAALAVPSVVNIEVTASDARSRDGELPGDHPAVPGASNGSGVAFKRAASGGTYVLTNNHVVRQASDIRVRDASGRSTKAKLIGGDSETDIAVVLVEAEIPLIELGDSRALEVGQTVIAIGSPFGLEHTVTSGVVSALGRSLPDFTDTGSNYPLVDVIQTDAAINPGNSGGALVDRNGRLVGVNTAIYSDSGASGGIGFAIPVATAIRVAEQLIAGNGVKHPFLGIVGTTVNAALVAKEALAVDEGAYVSELTKGSGAEEAGVKPGDVVTKVNGKPIRSMDDLILQVRRLQVGDRVKLELNRAGRTLNLEVEVGNKPTDFEVQSREETPTRRPGETPDKNR